MEYYLDIYYTELLKPLKKKRTTTTTKKYNNKQTLFLHGLV